LVNAFTPAGPEGSSMSVYNKERTFVSTVGHDHPRYGHLHALITKEGSAGGKKGKQQAVLYTSLPTLVHFLPMLIYPCWHHDPCHVVFAGMECRHTHGHEHHQRWYINVGVSTLVPTLVHDTHRLYSFISSGYFNAFYDRSTEEAVVHAHELLPFDAKCDW
jgi:hypothetical protein